METLCNAIEILTNISLDSFFVCFLSLQQQQKLMWTKVTFKFLHMNCRITIFILFMLYFYSLYLDLFCNILYNLCYFQSVMIVQNYGEYDYSRNGNITEMKKYYSARGTRWFLMYHQIEIASSNMRKIVIQQRLFVCGRGIMVHK